MNKEAVQRLREPAAWVLLAAAGVHLLAGIIRLLGGNGEFTSRAYAESGSGVFSQVSIVGLLVLAVLLATWNEAARQARNITMGALGVLGGMVLFGVISWLGGMLAEGHDSIYKLAVFLIGAAKIAVMGVGVWFVLTVFQGMQPARPKAPAQMQPGYPDFGYQQGQPGQFGGYQQQPGQPGQYQQFQQGGYQPGAEGQQHPQQFGGQQQYGQPQQYGQQPAQPGQQQFGGQEQYGQGGYQQPQPGQPGQPGHTGGQPGQSEEEMGEWTRAYGGGSQGAPDQGPQGTQPAPPQPGEQRPEDGGDWYRDNRPPPPQ